MLFLSRLTSCPLDMPCSVLATSSLTLSAFYISAFPKPSCFSRIFAFFPLPIPALPQPSLSHQLPLHLAPWWGSCSGGGEWAKPRIGAVVLLVSSMPGLWSKNRFFSMSHHPVAGWLKIQPSVKHPQQPLKLIWLEYFHSGLGLFWSPVAFHLDFGWIWIDFPLCDHQIINN